jgi:predicted Zn-dependent protease
MAAQAGAVQTQLSYSRDFEREADRVGMQALNGAGFDPRAMASFFERLQRSTRVADDGTLPGYLRSHPITSERIADAQTRASDLPYKQPLDSLEFHLVRAKLRAETGDVNDALEHFRSALRDGRFASEAAARYGLAASLLRARRAKEAEAELGRLRATKAQSPMIEALAARTRQALSDHRGASTLLAEAYARYPRSRATLYAYVGALQDAGRNDEALAVLAEPVRLHPRDGRLHDLQAKTYAALGKRLLQHKSLAEVYALQGALPAAIEQLQLARNAGDGDFYQLSVVEARLRELRTQHAQELKEMKR